MKKLSSVNILLWVSVVLFITTAGFRIHSFTRRDLDRENARGVLQGIFLNQKKSMTANHSYASTLKELGFHKFDPGMEVTMLVGRFDKKPAFLAEVHWTGGIMAINSEGAIIEIEHRDIPRLDTEKPLISLSPGEGRFFPPSMGAKE